MESESEQLQRLLHETFLTRPVEWLAKNFAAYIASIEYQKSEIRAELENLATKSANRRTVIARAGAEARHAGDPKQLAKNEVMICFFKWYDDPSRYRSIDAFALDMINKYEQLQSPRNVAGWARKWSEQINVRFKGGEWIVRTTSKVLR